jgi:hypothetical protein
VEGDGEWRTFINILIGNRTGYAFTIRHLPVATDSFYASQKDLTVGLSGVELRVPTSLARQCLCRGPMLLAIAWFFAFGCQVGNTAIPFEKSASVLEVHLTEALLVERGRFLFTIVGEIPTVVLQRCFRSSGARGG